MEPKEPDGMPPAVRRCKVLREYVCGHALRVAIFHAKDATAKRLVGPTDVDSVHALNMAKFRELACAYVQRSGLIVL